MQTASIPIEPGTDWPRFHLRACGRGRRPAAKDPPSDGRARTRPARRRSSLLTPVVVDLTRAGGWDLQRAGGLAAAELSAPRAVTPILVAYRDGRVANQDLKKMDANKNTRKKMKSLY